MKIEKKWIWIIVGIVVALVFLNFFIKWINKDVVKVKTAIVSKGYLEAVVSASGYVDAPVYDLGTKFGGRIENIGVREGEWVKKGQLLATFDNYEQAKNDYNRAKTLFAEGAQSKQAYDNAKVVFESARIIAPAGGVVAKINYDEGETAVPGSAAIIVVNYDKSWVEAQIDEIDIGSVKVGDKVKITCDVYPDKSYDGEITWIAPLAELRKVGGRVKIDEESYVFPCKIKFLGSHDELKVNMTVNADVVTKKNDNALIIPREAIVSKDDTSSVFVIKRNRAHETKIEIGIRSFNSVEATAGVAEKDIIAITNVSKLKDKGRVKIER